MWPGIHPFSLGKEEEDLASLEKTWREVTSASEDKEKEEKDEDHASPKATMLENPLDPEEYFTSHVLQSHDGPDTHLYPFLEGWAQRRYNEHSLRMIEPGLMDLRRVAKNITVDHVIGGKKRLLSLLVLEGNRHMGSGPWQRTFYNIILRWGGGSAGGWRIGAKSFNHRAPPEAVWLFMDMLHLIMLLANQTNAKKDALHIWSQEAKIFLLGMELRL